jgi:hypothetical protein
MSRKSVVSAPGTGRRIHVDPPSSVLKTVPFDPLAQAVRSSTTETPRRLAFVPLAWTIQEKPGACGGFDRSVTHADAKRPAAIASARVPFMVSLLLQQLLDRGLDLPVAAGLSHVRPAGFFLTFSL